MPLNILLLEDDPAKRDSVVTGMGKTNVPELLESVVKAVAFAAWLSPDVGRLLVSVGEVVAAEEDAPRVTVEPPVRVKVMPSETAV